MSIGRVALLRRKDKGPADDRPVLAVDVDGVISLFGFDGPARRHAAGAIHLIDGMAHCISDAAGPQLLRLAEVYELVWATGWETRANDHLPLILGLEASCPCSPSTAGRGSAPPTGSSRRSTSTPATAPLAWMDDSLDESCYDWAAEREAPTLLCPTESHIGLTEAHTEALLAWARDGYTAP